MFCDQTRFLGLVGRLEGSLTNASQGAQGSVCPSRSLSDGVRIRLTTTRAAGRGSGRGEVQNSDDLFDRREPFFSCTDSDDLKVRYCSL